MRIMITGFLILLAGCATGYNPDNAAISVQDQMRNSNPKLHCPTSSVVACDVEGGGLVGRTYSNCRCVR